MGTKDAMYWFDRWVKQKWSEGKFVAILFLDVKSAYPSVNSARMVNCLINKGCPLYICRIIHAFLDNQSTKIRMEYYISRPFIIHQGLPQGSPLSVILYILYNSSLLEVDLRLDSDQISLGYVDDVVHLAAS